MADETERLGLLVGVFELALTRLFEAATGQTPLRYQQVLRVERAENLIGHGATVEAAARRVPGLRRVGVLATDGTLAARTYHDELARIGSCARTRKPPSGIEPASNVPPSSAARSRIPSRPCPPPPSAGVDRPSSRISIPSSWLP